MVAQTIELIVKTNTSKLASEIAEVVKKSIGIGAAQATKHTSHQRSRSSKKEDEEEKSASGGAGLGKMMGVFSKIAGILGLSYMVMKAFAPVFDVLQATINALLKPLVVVAIMFLKPMGILFGIIARWVLTNLKPILDKVGPIWESLAKWFEGVAKLIGDLFSGKVNLVDTIINWVKEGLTIYVDFYKLVYDWVVLGLGETVNIGAKIIDWVKDSIFNRGGEKDTVFNSSGTTLAKDLSDKLKKAVGNIIGGGEKPKVVFKVDEEATKKFSEDIDKAIAKQNPYGMSSKYNTNMTIEPLNNFFNDITKKIGNFIGGIGKMFGFAEGGIVSSPTHALIGEKGPEAVMPLNSLYAKLDELIYAVKDSKTTITGDELGRFVDRYNDIQSNRTCNNITGGFQ